MISQKAARRYTTALYSIAEELNLVDSVKKDFEDIKKSIDGSRELKLFIESPIISSDKKASIINTLFEKKVTDLTLKFLLLLCEKNRINILYNISNDLLKLVNQMRGIVDAKVTTAIEISAKEKNSIASKLKQYTGKEIDPDFRVDKTIKGGFIAQIEDKIIDASLQRQLELLMDKLVQGSFNN
jgi:F-type H+-transporting ATPase subunit delta